VVAYAAVRALVQQNSAPTKGRDDKRQDHKGEELNISHLEPFQCTPRSQM
jgi:hypothetical protein